MQKETKLSRAKFIWHCYGCRFYQRLEGTFYLFPSLCFLEKLILPLIWLCCVLIYMQCALGNIEFVDILKVIRMEYTMLCDVKTGGCGITNLVHHILSKCPPVFIIGKLRPPCL